MASLLAKKIRKIREAETKGRHEFSEIIKIPKKTIEGIEQTGRVPRGDVLEAICKKWPKYSLWLMTGNEMPEAGQVSPKNEKDGLNNHRREA